MGAICSAIIAPHHHLRLNAESRDSNIVKLWRVAHKHEFTSSIKSVPLIRDARTIFTDYNLWANATLLSSSRGPSQFSLYSIRYYSSSVKQDWQNSMNDRKSQFHQHGIGSYHSHGVLDQLRQRGSARFHFNTHQSQRRSSHCCIGHFYSSKPFRTKNFDIELISVAHRRTVLGYHTICSPSAEDYYSSKRWATSSATSRVEERQYRH